MDQKRIEPATTATSNQIEAHEHEFAERTQCASPHFLFWTFFDRFVDSTPQNMTIYVDSAPHFATPFEYLNDLWTYWTL